MKSQVRHTLHNILLAPLFLLAMQPGYALAQKGRWVEHGLPTGSGGGLYSCGDRVIAYSRTLSSSCLFYDAQRSQWVEAGLGAVQNFREVLSQGDVALARSDSLVVAYSALTGSWDTTRVVGEYLTPAVYLSKHFAVVVTDEVMEVFDSEDGTWHRRMYTPPFDFTGYALVQASDDYAVLVLPTTAALSRQIVYSFPMHEFNSIDGMASPVPMDGGYVAVTYDPVSVVLLGYSASTNSFSTETVMIHSVTATQWGCRDRTGTSCGFVYNEVLNGDSRQDHYYSYDTKAGGAWSYAMRYFDIRYETNSQLIAGDRFVVFPITHRKPYDECTITYVIYSGASGAYVTRPDRTLYNSSTTSYHVGSNCFVAIDSIKAWIFDASSGGEHFESIEHNWMTINTETRQDFTAFVRYNPETDTVMTAYAYSTVTGAVASMRLPASLSATQAAGHSTLLISVPSNPPVVAFYSGQTNTYQKVEFPFGSYPAGAIQDYLALSTVGTDGYLFDATSGSLQSVQAHISRSRLGTSAFLYWDAGLVAHGYSTGTRQWSTVQMEADGYTMDLKDHIGLVSTTLGQTAFGRYYAYNGLYDGWVPLTPAGQYSGHQVGNRTALVVRTALLYAFDPELTTSIAEAGGIPLRTELEQNYPNPFNPSTTIRFALSQKSTVRLAVFNILGQEVDLLVQGDREAGYHEAQFDGSRLSSGVYVCRLEAGTFVQARKLLLIR